MTTTGDLIRQSLQAIAATWQVEPAQTAWEDDGFIWTPGSHLVRVRGWPDDATNSGRVRIVVETDLLNDVPMDGPHFRAMLAATSASLTAGYALVYPPAEVRREAGGRIPPLLSMFSAAYVSVDTVAWLPVFLARMALMQPADAQFRAGEFAGLLGGTPAVIASRVLLSCDEILYVVPTYYVSQGTEPNRWIGSDEFESFAASHDPASGVVCRGEPGRLTVHTPFGAATALIEVRTDQGHPVLGAGLLVTLELPPFTDLDEAIALAARLNFEEAARFTHVPQFGFWHPFDDGIGKVTLIHTSFIPNALYQPNLVPTMAYWSGWRADLVCRLLWPGQADLTVAESLAVRLDGMPLQ